MAPMPSSQSGPNRPPLDRDAVPIIRAFEHLRRRRSAARRARPPGARTRSGRWRAMVGPRKATRSPAARRRPAAGARRAASPAREQRGDAVVRGDDPPGAGEQLGLARDQLGIGAEIGDRRGRADLRRGGVEPAVDLGERIAAHHHVEAAPAERARLVEPGQPGLRDHQMAGAIVDRPGQRAGRAARSCSR